MQKKKKQAGGGHEPRTTNLLQEWKKNLHKWEIAQKQVQVTTSIEVTRVGG